MDNIIVGFSRPKKWKPFAALIMVGYNIPYDHVYIKFNSDYYKRDIIYQASSTMVNFMSPIIFEEKNIIVKEFQIPISDNNKKAMVQFAIDNAGKPYGIMGCFGLIIVRICELFNKNIKNPFGDGEQSYICCKLGAKIVEEYNHIDVPYDLDTINPKQLFDFMEKITNG